MLWPREHSPLSLAKLTCFSCYIDFDGEKHPQSKRDVQPIGYFGGEAVYGELYSILRLLVTLRSDPARRS